MTSTNNTYDDVTMVVADLDGTLLHDGETFEDRFLTQRSIDSINRMHDAGIKFVVETARPVSTSHSAMGISPDTKEMADRMLLERAG